MHELGQHLAVELGGQFQAHGPFAELPCLHLPDGTRVDLDCTDGRFTVTLRLIQVNRKGAGAGSRVMVALRAYCDRTGKTLEIVDVENPHFFQRFGWLYDWDDAFSYEPS